MKPNFDFKFISSSPGHVEEVLWRLPRPVLIAEREDLLRGGRPGQAAEAGAGEVDKVPAENRSIKVKSIIQ